MGNNSEEELSEDAPALNIKRYDLEQRGEYDCYGVMEENPYGDWVKYEDVVELLKQSKSLSEHIVKLPNGKYQLRSKKKNKQGKTKNLGTFGSRAAAEKHEQEVQYFKHANESVGSNIKEAKSLKKKVRIGEGEHSGKTGWIREIKHGKFKGAPKSYNVDLDGGRQADNLPGTSLRLIIAKDTFNYLPLQT